MALVLSASMVLHPERKVAVQAWGYLIHMGFKFVQGKTPLDADVHTPLQVVIP
jgi:hypothetical protein